MYTKKRRTGSIADFRLMVQTERGKNILYEKQVSHLHDLHRKKVEGMTSHLAKLGHTAKPKTIPKVPPPSFLLHPLGLPSSRLSFPLIA